MTEFEFRLSGLTEDQIDRSRLHERRPKASPHGPRSFLTRSNLSLAGFKVSTAVALKIMIVLVAAYAISHPVPRIDPARLQINIPPGANPTDRAIRLTKRIFPLSGRVNDKKTKTVELDANGLQLPVPVNDDRTFSVPVPLVAGENKIQVVAGSFASQIIRVYAHIPKVDIPKPEIRIALGRDNPGPDIDVDLHVILPSGADCWENGENKGVEMPPNRLIICLAPGFEL